MPKSRRKGPRPVKALSSFQRTTERQSKIKAEDDAIQSLSSAGADASVITNLASRFADDFLPRGGSTGAEPITDHKEAVDEFDWALNQVKLMKNKVSSFELELVKFLEEFKKRGLENELGRQVLRTRQRVTNAVRALASDLRRWANAPSPIFYSQPDLILQTLLIYVIETAGSELSELQIFDLLIDVIEGEFAKRGKPLAWSNGTLRKLHERFRTNKNTAPVYERLVRIVSNYIQESSKRKFLLPSDIMFIAAFADAHRRWLR